MLSRTLQTLSSWVALLAFVVVFVVFIELEMNFLIFLSSSRRNGEVRCFLIYISFPNISDVRNHSHGCKQRYNKFVSTKSKTSMITVVRRSNACTIVYSVVAVVVRNLNRMCFVSSSFTIFWILFRCAMRRCSLTRVRERRYIANALSSLSLCDVCVFFCDTIFTAIQV